MEIANGSEEDGIKYRCLLKGRSWNVEVISPDGRVLNEEFSCIARPVCGPDAMDVYRAEEIMDKLIKQIRGNNAKT